jgi:antitoxin (DNA-binding transcriptional repressor) of toxin-antitoxin stability system
MTSITLQDAQASLASIVHGLQPGEEILITENDQPVAKILPALSKPSEPKRERQLGTMRGSVIYMADDFDAPLEDFKDYM